MKSVRVAGMFNVTLDVEDHLGRSISRIDSTMRGCRNVVSIKNICTLPKQVGVEVLLPNGTTSVEFLVGGSTSSSKWSDQTAGAIANGGTGKLGCSMRRTSGPNSFGESIQLDKLYSGDGPPKPLVPVVTSKIPFQITIDAV